MRLFAERGFAGVSTRDIVDASGFHAPAIYRHFKDKSTLYTECIRTNFRRMSERVFIPTENISPSRALFRITHNICVLFLSEDHMPKLLMQTLVDRDFERLPPIMENMLALPSNALVPHIAPLSDGYRVEEKLFTIYAQIIGIAYFAPMSRIIRFDLPWLSDPTSIAVRVLDSVYPGMNWSRLAEEYWAEEGESGRGRAVDATDPE